MKWPLEILSLFLKKLIKTININILYAFVFLISGNTLSANYLPKILSAETNWTTKEFTVNFVISTYDHRFYTKLTEDNIQPLINSNSVAIQSLSSTRALLPNKLFFVLDKSGSMNRNKRYQSAVSKINEILKFYGKSTLGALVTVSDEIKYFPVAQYRLKWLNRNNAEGKTRVYDGVYTALNHIRQGVSGIPAIIVLTDGKDLHSKYKVSDCLRINAGAKVPIFVILFGPTRGKSIIELERLSDLSNGKIFYVQDKVSSFEKYIIKKGLIYTLVLKLPPNLNNKWQNLQLEFLIGNKGISLNKKIKIRKPKQNQLKKNLLVNKGIFVNVFIGIFAVVFIFLVVWFAHRNATTKKCPFCSKRYNINEEQCPYCHQNTMFLYENNGNNDQHQPLIERDIIEEDGFNIDDFTVKKQPAADETKIIETNLDVNTSDKTRVLDEELPVLAYIIVKKGERIGYEYPLRSGINTVGRNIKNEIQIDDKAVSHAHAKIFWDEEKKAFILNDLASTNGTYINDVEVIQQELKDKDTIKIGQTEFTFIHVL